MPIGYTAEIEQLMQTHYGRLSEKERRHYAAIEAVKLGRGGTSYISWLFGITRNTVMRGTEELKQVSEELPQGRQRRAGGGRKKNFNSNRNAGSIDKLYREA
jgi:hypothetical protein